MAPTMPDMAAVPCSGATLAPGRCTVAREVSPKRRRAFSLASKAPVTGAVLAKGGRRAGSSSSQTAKDDYDGMKRDELLLECAKRHIKGVKDAKKAIIAERLQAADRGDRGQTSLDLMFQKFTRKDAGVTAGVTHRAKPTFPQAVGPGPEGGPEASHEHDAETVSARHEGCSVRTPARMRKRVGIGTERETKEEEKADGMKNGMEGNAHNVHGMEGNAHNVHGMDGNAHIK